MTFMIYLFVIFIIVVRFLRGSSGSGKKGSGAGRSSVGKKGFSDMRQNGGAYGGGQAGRGALAGGRPVASDGHRVPRDQDVSCRRFGHRHEEFDTPRYIPHTDPEEGYIILNGVKMRLRDADRYEDRI